MRCFHSTQDAPRRRDICSVISVISVESGNGMDRARDLTIRDLPRSLCTSALARSACLTAAPCSAGQSTKQHLPHSQPRRSAVQRFFHLDTSLDHRLEGLLPLHPPRPLQPIPCPNLPPTRPMRPMPPRTPRARPTSTRCASHRPTLSWTWTSAGG